MPELKNKKRAPEKKNESFECCSKFTTIYFSDKPKKIKKIEVRFFF